MGKRLQELDKTKDVYQAIKLLNNREIGRLAAVISWYQLHNKNDYFLDESKARYFFLDICLKNQNWSSIFRMKKIRKEINNQLTWYLKFDAENVLLTIIKMIGHKEKMIKIKTVADEYGGRLKSDKRNI